MAREVLKTVCGEVKDMWHFLKSIFVYLKQSLSTICVEVLSLDDSVQPFSLIHVITGLRLFVEPLRRLLA